MPTPALPSTALHGGQSAVMAMEDTVLTCVAQYPGLTFIELQNRLAADADAPFETIFAALLHLYGSKRLETVRGVVTLVATEA